MNLELKPCPFCGGKAKFVIVNELHEYKDVFFRVECESCGIHKGKGRITYKFDDDLNVFYTRDDREELANEWNERAE